MDIVFCKRRIRDGDERRAAAAGGKRRPHHPLLQDREQTRAAAAGTFGLGCAPCRSLRPQRRIALRARLERSQVARDGGEIDRLKVTDIFGIAQGVVNLNLAVPALAQVFFAKTRNTATAIPDNKRQALSSISVLGSP